MSKICVNCRREINDNASHCRYCGSPQGNTAQQGSPHQQPYNGQQQYGNQYQQPYGGQQQYGNQYQQPYGGQQQYGNHQQPYSGQQRQQGSQPQSQAAIQAMTQARAREKKLIITIIAGSIAAVTAAVILIVVLLGGSYEAPVKSMMKAITEGDAKYLDDVFPSFITNSNGYSEDSMDSLLTYFHDYADNISCEIIDSDEIDSDKLDVVEAQLSRSYEESITIKKGYDVEVKMTYEVDDDKQSRKETFSVYKIDGEWRIVDVDKFTSFISVSGGRR